MITWLKQRAVKKAYAELQKARVYGDAKRTKQAKAKYHAALTKYTNR